MLNLFNQLSDSVFFVSSIISLDDSRCSLAISSLCKFSSKHFFNCLVHVTRDILIDLEIKRDLILEEKNRSDSVENVVMVVK